MYGIFTLHFVDFMVDNGKYIPYMDAMGNGFGRFVGRSRGSPNTTVVHICQVTSWKSTGGTLWKQLGRSESLQGYGLHWITTTIIQNNLRMSRLSRLT